MFIEEIRDCGAKIGGVVDVLTHADDPYPHPDRWSDHGMAYQKSSRVIGEWSITHGHTSGGRSPTYRTWHSMKERCSKADPHIRYKYYGVKGIAVCERWRTFANFLADMGARPEGKTLDRIDSAKGYEPDNCRWATPVEQKSNQRQRTHCKRGHPFSYENTYVTRDGRRNCRRCKTPAGRVVDHQNGAAQ